MIKSEEQRLRELGRLMELDFNKSSEFQDILGQVLELCDKPVALITIVGAASNWFKVKYEALIDISILKTSFFEYGIQENDLFNLPGAKKDLLFTENLLVYSDPHLRYYTGVPLIDHNGLNLGKLYLFDQKPDELTEVQKKILRILGRQVTFLLELKMSRIELKQQIEETNAKHDSLMKIAQLQSHQIRQPLTTIMGLINLVKQDHQEIDEDWLKMFERATTNFDKTIYQIVAESFASKDLRMIRFNKMVEEIDDYAILLLDESGMIENWNKGAEKIKGYLSDEIVGKNFSVFYTHQDIKNNRPKKLIRQAEEHGVARDEGWRVRKDGTKFWGSIVITAIHNDHEKVIGFTKVTRDLTAIKDAQDAQAVSLDLYKHVIEQTYKKAHVGGWELDLVTNVLSWTAITKEIHGVDDNYIPDIKSAINFYKDGASKIKIVKAIKLSIKKGVAWDLELQIVTKQEKKIWIHTVGKSNYRDGICTKVYGTFQDIDKPGKKKADPYKLEKPAGYTAI